MLQHHPRDPNRPEGMSVRHYQMYKRFPQGSYARIRRDAYDRVLRGEVVQIVEALKDSGLGPTTFRVLVSPFKEHQHECRVGRCLRDFLMRDLGTINEMEVLAEASR